MIWKRYQNELMVAVALLLLIVALIYKNVQVSSSTESLALSKQEVREFKELVILKKRWLDKKTSKKLDKLQKLVPSSKVKWQKKGKKLTASFRGLSSQELNKVITMILNLAVQIELLEIKNDQGSYNVEFKCKW
jgi:hypothetical protein